MSIFSIRQFLGAFENTPWIEGKTMQPVSIYIHQGRQFEDTFENTQRRPYEPHGPVQKVIEPKEAKVNKLYQAHESKSL